MAKEAGTMNAVVAYGPGDYRYDVVKAPVPGYGELLVKIEACGICAGDIKAYQGGKRFWGDGIEPSYMEVPAIPGHEFIGRITDMREGFAGKDGLKVGDRVISEQIVPCGKCRFCRNNQYWMCRRHDVYGFKNHLNGGFAEYMIFPENSITHKVPDSIPFEDAILIEPYSCSFHAVERAGILPGDIVVISGAGPLGLGMVTCAKARNPGKLVVLDLNEFRLGMAKLAGADLALNPQKEDVPAIIREMTEGYGCDVYIEATGYPGSVLQGMELIRKKGRFVEFSVFNDNVTMDWSIIGDMKELDIFGVSLSPFCYPKAIEGIYNGSLFTKGIVTDILSLSRFKEAFDICIRNKDSIKVVLTPDSANES